MIFQIESGRLYYRYTIGSAQRTDGLQGVTFEVLSESSISPITEATAAVIGAMLQEEDLEITWRQLGEYLEVVEQSGVSPNFATFVSAATVRINVLGMGDVDPTPEQLEAMKAQVEKAMQDGALGLTTALIPDVSRYCAIVRRGFPSPLTISCCPFRCPIFDT